MKKQLLTILTTVLLLAAAWFLDAFLGNPVSALLVRRNARNYMESTYPELRIEDVRYSFKDGKYHAFVVSDSSQDTHFTLYYNRLGQLTADTYEDYVANGWNTVRRLEAAYQQQTDPILKSLPYHVTIGFCQLNYLFPEESASEVPALRLSELVPDKDYDISQLGEEYGQLILYLTVEDISPEAAADILLTLDRHLASVPYHSLDLTLQKAEGGQELYLRNFPRTQIIPEDLENKILQNHRQAEETYAQMDKEPPIDGFFQAVFPEDGSVQLTCGEETLTFSMGSLPADSTILGAARIDVLSPGAVRASFGDTAILFLEEGAAPPDVTADILWGHVTQSHGALFAILPEAPSEALRQTLEAEGMNLLIPAELGTVSAESAGTEFLLTWTTSTSMPAMSAPK